LALVKFTTSIIEAAVTVYDRIYHARILLTIEALGVRRVLPMPPSGESVQTADLCPLTTFGISQNSDESGNIQTVIRIATDIYYVIHWPIANLP